MKRLKTIFRSMELKTETYSAMYEAPIVLQPPTTEEAYDDRDPAFFSDDIAFVIESPPKNAQDKPIVLVRIPAEFIDPQLGAMIEGSANAEVPDELTEHLRDAAADFCLRAFAEHLDVLNESLYNRSRPDRENGKYSLFRPGGEILRRNTAFFDVCPQRDYDYLTGIMVRLWDPEEHPCPPKLCLCFRLEVQFPFRKLKKAMTMITSDLPDAVDAFIASLDRQALRKTLFIAEKQFRIRQFLRSSPWCAFIANGSILPRAKDGVDPLEGAVPFRSTPDDEIELCGIRGMGIPRGVTVITGGGYSGKSTLLDAVAAGIYDHRAGDGREFVLTDETAVSIAAEDGRAVSRLNIGPFLKSLPGGNSPTDFTTSHASGSTSQASGIMEAVSSGSRLLLIDEDRSATNFMIRDAKMKALIKKEPITPFTDRVQELAKRGVSTILVIGGSGEYLDKADRVYLMDDYRISDATAHAKKIRLDSDGETETPPPCDWEVRRVLMGDGFSSYPENSGTERLEANDMGFLIIGSEQIDLRGIFSLITDAQRTAAAFILRTVMVNRRPGPINLAAELDALYRRIRREGVHAVYTSFFTTMRLPMELPRRIDIEAIVNRMRRQRWK